MKITGIDTHLVAPVGEREFFRSTLSWFFVEVRTDEGITGLGECSNWPGGGNRLVSRAIESFAETLIGRDPNEIESIWHHLFRRYTFLGNRGVISTAMSGIDIALWDIKGKALGRPIVDLLGGPVRDSVPVYTHADGETWELVAGDALSLVDEGYSAFKFDPFRETHDRHTGYLGGDISRAGISEGVAAISHLRDALGPEVDILIDFHGSYNVASALRCIDALSPFDITWFEEPMPPENLLALRQLRAQTDAPLCVGERLFTRWDFLPILADGLANYVMPDVCWTGGISELKKIATLAETHAVPIAPHGALGPIQTIAGAHVMLGAPNCYKLEVLGSFWQPLYNKCIDPDLELVRGGLVLSDRPGLGVDLDMEFVRANARPGWA